MIHPCPRELMPLRMVTSDTDNGERRTKMFVKYLSSLNICIFYGMCSPSDKTRTPDIAIEVTNRCIFLGATCFEQNVDKYVIALELFDKNNQTMFAICSYQC